LHIENRYEVQLRLGILKILTYYISSIDTRVAISSQGAIYRPHSPAVSLSLSASPSLSGAAEKMVLYIQISDARPIIWNWYITIKFLMYYVLSILTGLYGI